MPFLKLISLLLEIVYYVPERIVSITKMSLAIRF